MPKARVKSHSPKYRWLVFILLAVAYMLVYFHRLSPAVVALDMMRDLKAGPTLMGLMASAYFYPYAVMQIPAGLLSDSWGPRRTITIFFLLAALASIALGLVGSVGGAIAARVLVGLGVAMIFVPTMKILTRWFSRAEFSRMTGFLIAIGGLGGLGAAAPLAYLSTVLGWRGSFQAIGLATLVLAVIIWLLVRNRPEEMGLPPVEPPEASVESDKKTVGLLQGMKMVLTSWRFWPLAVWFFFCAGIFFAFGGLWGGPYLMHVYGLTRSQAGSILSMLAVGMVVGGPILSHLSDHVFHSRKKILLVSAVLLILTTIPIVFHPGGQPIWFLYLFCFLLGLFGSATVVIGFTTAKELFPLEIAGTAVGLVNLFPFIGGAILQLVVGTVLEGQGQSGGVYSAEAYGQAFHVFFYSALVVLVAAFFIKETFGDAR